MLYLLRFRIAKKPIESLNFNRDLLARVSENNYFICFDKQTLCHILNLQFGDKVLCPFTDSEFQRVEIQPISQIFLNFFGCSSFHGVSENTENYSKKARKFVLRKTNLRALKDFGIILSLDSGGINLVSTSDFRCLFQIVRAKNPCNIKVFSTTQQPLWVIPIRQMKPPSKLFCIGDLIPFDLI